jgi:hypothetical protein
MKNGEITVNISKKGSKVYNSLRKYDSICLRNGGRLHRIL